MNSKKGLSRIMSALLAATSVVGQAGAAPKRRPKSAPAAINNKNVKKKGTPDKESFWKHLHENPHNWAHLGLGIAAGGFGGLWLYEKLKGVKGGDSKLNELRAIVSIVSEDGGYLPLLDYAGKLLAVDAKSGLDKYEDFWWRYCSSLEKTTDKCLDGAEGGFSGIKTVDALRGKFGLSELEFSDDDDKSLDELCLEPELKGDFGVLIDNDGSISVKFRKGEYFEGAANLLLRKILASVCVRKKLFENIDMIGSYLGNGRYLVLDDENFLSYLGKLAGKDNEGKVKEVWDKLKGFSDLYLEIIKEKSKGIKDNKKDDKEKDKN